MREWVIFNLEIWSDILHTLFWYSMTGVFLVLYCTLKKLFGLACFVNYVWYLAAYICSQWHSPSSVSEVFGVAHPRPPWLWHRPHPLEASHKSPAWYHTTSSHILCHLLCDIDQFFTLVLTSVWLDGERRENILEMFSRNEKLTQLQKIYLGRISRKSVGEGWAAVGAGREEIPTITGTAC